MYQSAFPQQAHNHKQKNENYNTVIITTTALFFNPKDSAKSEKNHKNSQKGQKFHKNSAKIHKNSQKFTKIQQKSPKFDNSILSKSSILLKLITPTTLQYDIHPPV